MVDYRQRVEQLPDLDNPASFGMAANADRSLQRINSTLVISTLRQLASAANSGGGQIGSAGLDIKVWKEQLGPLWKVWDNLGKAQMGKLKTVEIREPTIEDSPVVTFVLMDAAEAGRLVDLVSNALANMQKVVAGSLLSSPEIIGEANCLMRNEVPLRWCSTWAAAPEDPAVFLQGLAKRLVALKTDWVRRVMNPQQIFAQPVVLADFLRPDVFLNALRQQTARALKISIDGLHLVSTFEPSLISDPSQAPIPVVVQGLVLEGCIFDESRRLLVEGTRTSPLTSLLPPLTVAWMSKAGHPDRAATTAKGSAAVAMPIYAALSRERLVGEVHLHTESRRSRVLNATALFLTENE
jgi:dynein heavy chain 2